MITIVMLFVSNAKKQQMINVAIAKLIKFIAFPPSSEAFVVILKV